MKMTRESSPEELDLYEEVFIRKKRVGYPWKQKTSKSENRAFAGVFLGIVSGERILANGFLVF